MSIATEISRLQTAKANLKTAIEGKGVTVPTVTKLDGYPLLVESIQTGGSDHWVRPSDWPDIDALAGQLQDTDSCMYLTYDLRKTPGYGWIGIYAVTNPNTGKFYIERGHIDNNAFTTDESFECSSGTYFRHALNESYGNVQLWRVRSDSGITQYGFCSNSDVTNECMDCRMQPCVDKSGVLAYFYRSTTDGNANNTAKICGTYWLEHDSLIIGTKSNVWSLQSYWNNCYRLVSIDLSGWDTSGWDMSHNAALSYLCAGCYSLKEIDLKYLDVSNWTSITGMFQSFHSCYSIKEFDFSSWDVSEWTSFIGFNTTFYNCYSLESVCFDEWELTVTDMGNAFVGCANLKELDLSMFTFNFSSGNKNIFGSCPSLRDIKVPSSWGTGAGTNSTNIQMLVDFSGFENYVDHSFSNALMLTHQSLLSILNKLPETQTTKTITLGKSNMAKLTSEEIQIATAKGWTVA